MAHMKAILSKAEDICEACDEHFNCASCEIIVRHDGRVIVMAGDTKALKVVTSLEPKTK